MWGPIAPLQLSSLERCWSRHWWRVKAERKSSQEKTTNLTKSHSHLEHVLTPTHPLLTSLGSHGNSSFCYVLILLCFTGWVGEGCSSFALCLLHLSTSLAQGWLTSCPQAWNELKSNWLSLSLQLVAPWTSKDTSKGEYMLPTIVADNFFLTGNNSACFLPMLANCFYILAVILSLATSQICIILCSFYCFISFPFSQHPWQEAGVEIKTSYFGKKRRLTEVKCPRSCWRSGAGLGQTQLSRFPVLSPPSLTVFSFHPPPWPCLKETRTWITLMNTWNRGFPDGSVVKHPLANAGDEMWVWSLHWEVPWSRKSPWTEEPGGHGVTKGLDTT